jgi:diadenosine tetraphosphate (Ap4A) HIT family hydrolase
MTEAGDCYSCAMNSRVALAPRERVYAGERWRAAHAIGTALPGWLVLLPRRHVTALDELTAEEAAELGPLLSGLTAALREVTGCAKTYVALFAEAEGFAHLHFHVVPRDPGMALELRGPRVFGYMGRDQAEHVPDATMDKVAAAVTAALAGRL